MLFQTLSLVEYQQTCASLARTALALDNNDAEARAIFAEVLIARGDCEGALAEAEQALAMTPNCGIAHGAFGSALIFSGRREAGLAALETSLRLDPRGPYAAVRLNQITAGLYFCREYAKAVERAKRLIRSYPEFPLIHRWLAAALGQLGRTGDAKQALETAIAAAPASFDLYVRQRVPWMRPEDHAHMIEGLRKAGMPAVEPRAPQRRRNRLSSAATWLTWPQLGAGDEIWDILQAAIAAALGAG
jgi:adenylate cyclase